MAAYVVAQIDVTDPEAFAEYRAKVAETVARHGGRYKARGGEMEALEGDRPCSRMVVIEFDDARAAKRWYESEDYAPLIALRRSASRGSVVVVEGV